MPSAQAAKRPSASKPEQRRAAHERLRGQGVFSLDVEPLQLPVALVNQYLDIKSAGLL